MLTALLPLLLVLVHGAQCLSWSSLNTTLRGRLFSSEPIPAPCFEGSTNIACSSVQKGYVDPFYRVEQYASFMYPSWETCLAETEGCVLNFANPSDPAAWTNKTCQQGSVSSAYIAVESVADVQAAFAFARLTGYHLSIKNTGHDFIGRSALKNSLAIWTHKLNKISYDPKTIIEGGSETYRAITVGAGAVWNDVYAFAEAHNITAVGGYHVTVGASGGWLMGGGHSVLSPAFGLGVDRVLQFKIVTPDGVYRTANKYQNADLFWALRGGGGGTFGVVMESTMLVEPQVKLQVASISFDRTTQGVSDFVQIAIDNALQWGRDGWGGHVYGNSLIQVTPLLTPDQAKTSMKPAADYALSQNGTVVIEELPSFYSFFKKYVLSAQAVVGVHIVLGTRLIPKSIFTNETATALLHKALIDMSPYASVDPQILTVPPVLYNYTEGATSVTPAWRDALWHTIFAISLPWNATRPNMQQGFDLVQKLTQPLRDIAPDSGVYQNEAFIYEPDHENQFWGENYSRLLTIKNKYDSHRLLDCWNCVGSKSAQDARYSCYPPYSP